MTRLPARNAVLREEFSNLSMRSVRELQDGRILVVETGSDSRLVVADFKSGLTLPIGRRGAGPGEYAVGGPIFALSGDSTLMVAGQNRWIVLFGDRIVQTIALADYPPIFRSLLVGCDSSGFILVREPVRARSDSTIAVLLSRKQIGTKSSLALSNRAEDGYPPDPRIRGTEVQYSSGPWKSREDAFLFPDGWLAVARMRPYRIDWRSPEGKWILGAPLPVPRVEADEREKRAYLARFPESQRPSGNTSGTVALWPKFVPPFLSSSSLLGTADGKLLVARTPTSDHPEARYDVVNRAGRIERQIILGPADRILGLGVRSVYVSTTDESGIQQIARHAWPGP